MLIVFTRLHVDINSKHAWISMFELTATLLLAQVQQDEVNERLMKEASGYSALTSAKVGTFLFFRKNVNTNYKLFTFLFDIPGTSFIINVTEPITYYRNNDYPVCLPTVYLPHHTPTKHANAALVILTHQIDQTTLFETIHNLEDKFNRNFKYPYIFLTNQPLDNTIQSTILSTGLNVTFGLIPPENWSHPTWIDQEKFIQSYKSVNNNTNLENDQRMARYYSGFFFDHPLLQEYDWYWRIEPGSKLLCDITYDPFLYMERINKLYGFVLTSPKSRHSILPTYVRDYTASRRIQPKDDTMFPYFINTTCQFLSSFEIGSLDLWRNAAYRDFFRYLDQTGNFFYKFWSDASVHSLAAGLFLDRDQIHYFEDIGYQYNTYHNCPPGTLNCRCTCPVTTDYTKNTCISYWKEH